MVFTRDNLQAVFGPMKRDCARPPSVFARLSTCWLLFVPKSEIPLEGASLCFYFGHPESRDKYIKHHCKRRLLQRHPEAVWLYKSVCTVRRDVCRKLNKKSVVSFTQIPFIMPVLKLSRLTVYVKEATLRLLDRVLYNFKENKSVWMRCSVTLIVYIDSECTNWTELSQNFP